MNQSLSLCCQIVFTLRQQSGKRQIHKNCRAASSTGVCGDSLALPESDNDMTKQQREERKKSKNKLKHTLRYFCFFTRLLKKSFFGMKTIL